MKMNLQEFLFICCFSPKLASIWNVIVLLICLVVTMNKIRYLVGMKK